MSQQNDGDSNQLSYKDAGVDIEAGNQLVENIKGIVKQTQRPEVLTGLGGFGGLFGLDTSQYEKPVLVSGTDGVGTKLKIAIELEQHDTIGIDLVAMCVNDIVVTGAEPLFFLDYYATSKLEPTTAKSVISGIADGCLQANAALIGGETAEMPGIYQKDDYDLAGFAVGIVDQKNIIDGSKVKENDVLIGLASSGVHSNGFSLVRKVIEHSNAKLSLKIEGQTLGQRLLAPTKIYVKPILNLIKNIDVHTISHITGGGLIENLPRVIPADCQAVVDTTAWTRPELFNWIQQSGNINQQEMLRTFNCGIGMVVAVSPDSADAALQNLQASGEQAWVIGHIQKKASSDSEAVMFAGL